RHSLYCHARLRSRDRRSERQPLLIGRHGPQLVAPVRRPSLPEQRADHLSANGRYCLRARVTQILELFGKDSWRRTAGPSPEGTTLAAEATAKAGSQTKPLFADPDSIAVGDEGA